jgi:hypothetical protein
MRIGRKPATAALAAALCIAACPVSAGETEDRAEIVQLMLRYGEVHNYGTAEQYADLYASDGEIVAGGQVLLKGRDAIVAQTTRDIERFKVILPDGQATFLLRHLITNTVIASFDGDTATGSSYVTTLLRDGDEGPKIFSFGRYFDEYRRERGAWKIARRTIVTDFSNPELRRKYGFGR